MEELRIACSRERNSCTSCGSRTANSSWQLASGFPLPALASSANDANLDSALCRDSLTARSISFLAAMCNSASAVPAAAMSCERVSSVFVCRPLCRRAQNTLRLLVQARDLLLLETSRPVAKLGLRPAGNLAR